MKSLNILTLLMMFIFSNSYATTNTLALVDSYSTQGSKVCVYSDGHRTESVEKKGAGVCSSKKTFH